jgi:RNA ligase
LNSKYNVEPIPKGYTTLVEIIYPENRIVCSYGNDEVLVVLSMVSNASGKELDYDSLLKINEETGLPVIKKYDGIQDYKTLKTLISKDREGYVVRFRNGFRIKIKGDEYVRLHRILTGFSNVDIWEYLKDKKDLNELLDKVPDEFDAWVRNTVNELNSQFEGIEKEYQWIFKVTKRVEGIEDRKIFAEYAMRYKNPSILFSMLDNKNYDEIIWKLIRPQYSKPFWQKEDES